MDGWMDGCIDGRMDGWVDAMGSGGLKNKTIKSIT